MKQWDLNMWLWFTFLNFEFCLGFFSGYSSHFTEQNNLMLQ